jgi:hypothetical protein
MSVKDFFGKKLGGWVYEAASHLSPVNLRSPELGARISGALDNGGMLSAGGEIFGAVRSAIANRGDYRIGDWFAGRNIGEAAGTIENSIRNSRIAMRVGVPAAIGVAGVSGAVAPDNPLDRFASTGLQLGGHSMLAGLFGSRVGWGAGAGYAAFAGFNALRPGNNFGPF